MNDAGTARKDVYPIGKKNPNLPFHPAVRAGDFISSPARLRRTPMAT